MFWKKCTFYYVIISNFFAFVRPFMRCLIDVVCVCYCTMKFSFYAPLMSFSSWILINCFSPTKNSPKSPASSRIFLCYERKNNIPVMISIFFHPPVMSSSDFLLSLVALLLCSDSTSSSFVKIIIHFYIIFLLGPLHPQPSPIVMTYEIKFHVWIDKHDDDSCILRSLLLLFHWKRLPHSRKVTWIHVERFSTTFTAAVRMEEDET